MGLTNNDILKKLRVALKLRDDDMVRILKHVDYEISKSEINAFFRADDHPKYMQLKDQILRNFLNGLVIEKRGRMDAKKPKDKPTPAAQKTKAEPKPEPVKEVPKRTRKPFGGEEGKVIQRKKRPRIGE